MNGPQAKETIAAIAAYVPGRARAAGFARAVKLSANENGLGASPAARAAYAAAIGRLHLYPDPKAQALREALAARHGLAPDRIVFGAGSDELFSLACQAYLNPGDVMVQPQYAFAAWAIAARAAGAAVVSAPERAYCVDVDALLAAVDERTRIVFLANPANPTGTCLSFKEIARLHAGLPERVLLVLDGAYAEFAESESGYADGMALAKQAPNVLVTRTFSKLYGLAALRIGWGYASAPIAAALNKIRLPFNVSAPAQAAALAALGDEEFAQASIRHAVAGRADIARRFAALGFAALPHAANFVTLRHTPAAACDAGALVGKLAARGVLVRPLAAYGMADALRVSVGAPKEMDYLAEALARIAAQM